MAVVAHPNGSFVFTGGHPGIGSCALFGPSRVRVTKIGNQVTYGFRNAWAGVGPVAEMTLTFSDVRATAPYVTNTNARLFFGGGCPSSSFDDLAIATIWAPPAAPPATTIPATPTGFTASARGSTRVALGWTDASNDESGFRVERSPAGTSSWSVVANTGANIVTARDTTAVADARSDYRVRATNAVRESGPSNVATVTLGPRPPANLGAVATPTRISLAWSDGSSTETGFRVERSARGAGAWTAVGTTSANVTASDDTTATPENRYDYRVFAFNAAGDSDPSSVRAVDASPAAPSDRGAEPGDGARRRPRVARQLLVRGEPRGRAEPRRREHLRDDRDARPERHVSP